MSLRYWVVLLNILVCAPAWAQAPNAAPVPQGPVSPAPQAPAPPTAAVEDSDPDEPEEPTTEEPTTEELGEHPTESAISDLEAEEALVEDEAAPTEDGFVEDEVLGLDGEEVASERWDISDNEEQNALQWDDSWGHFSAWDYGLLGTSLATVVVAQIIGPFQKKNDPAMGAGWQGTARMDDFFRRHLRRDDFDERERVRDASDLTLSLSVSFPFLFDALISALWYHDEPRIGRELSLLAIEVQFLVAAIQSTTNMISSRVRPYVQDCGGPELPADNGDCNGSVRFRSFFSGHTSQAFAGAVTSCVFHGKLPLYGGGSRDIFPCVGLLAAATATGLFRVMGDMHHITDVITGALVGSGVGLMLPLLRMRTPRRHRRVAIVPSGMGLAVLGELP